MRHPLRSNLNAIAIRHPITFFRKFHRPQCRVDAHNLFSYDLLEIINEKTLCALFGLFAALCSNYGLVFASVSGMNQDRNKNQARQRSSGRRLQLMVALFFFGVATITLMFAVKFAVGKRSRVAYNPAATNSTGGTAPVSDSSLPTNEVAQAVMVTVELDFGPSIPSIAEALRFIERRHEPADGVGRVFAILDAYGEPTPDRKKLHMSMHVSMEKPGIGSLLFSKNREVLWKSKVLRTQMNTAVLVDGHLYGLDGDSGDTAPLKCVEYANGNRTP